MKLALLFSLLMAALLSACGTEPAVPTPTATLEVLPSSGIADTPTPPVIGTATPQTLESASGRSYKQYPQPPELTIDVEGTYTADIQTSMGAITVELYAEDAPLTVNNFVFLAGQGFYDGLLFHRVIPDFMIQGGDPTGTGSSGPGYRFQDEIVPSLTFDRPGVLAMANAGPNTNGSQFFITVAPTPHLTGNHTIFGQVADGQEVANAISLVRSSRENRPMEDVIIQAIRIKTSN